MDFMLQSVEVFTGQQKYFVQRNAVGRSMKDATPHLAHPLAPAISCWRFSSRDFNDGLQGGRNGRVTELAFAFSLPGLSSSSPILHWWEAV